MIHMDMPSIGPDESMLVLYTNEMYHTRMVSGDVLAHQRCFGTNSSIFLWSSCIVRTLEPE